MPRSTGDTDFYVRPSLANAERLIRALQRFGFGSVGLTEQDFMEPGRIVQLGIDPYRIDIITGITGVSFDEARYFINRSSVSCRIAALTNIYNCGER